jgi:sorbitol-specific phosphotransferase system component IIA
LSKQYQIQNKLVDILFSTHGAFLEQPSPGTIKVEQPSPGTIKVEQPSPGTIKVEQPSPGTIKVERFYSVREILQ